MTGNINLTASMRTNLLSLQQISKLQDRTQLRLSTGLKVNSAIDNPSSYYTAQSLNNRADDLSALLDSMGQGIQTIKAASEGIETAEDLVTQMKAIAEQVSASGTYVPDKEYFIKEVGANGAVVSTAEELRQAIADNKETICVYGKIDLGDISTSGGLSLQENQKLVGVEYFGNFKDGEGFSEISATDSIANHVMIDIKKTGCLVSDLSLNYENNVAAGETYGINVSGSGVVANLQNLDIATKFNDANINHKAALDISNNAHINIKGNLDITAYGKTVYGIFMFQGSVNTESQSSLNIKLSGIDSIGIRCFINSQLHMFKDTTMQIDAGAIGIELYDHSNYNSFYNSLINIKTFRDVGYGIYVGNNSIADISGNLSIATSGNKSYGIYNNYVNNSNKTIISSTASISFKTGKAAFFNGYSNTQVNNILEISSGAKLAFEKNGSTKWYEVQKDYKDENTSTTVNNQITADNIETTLNVASTSSWKTPADIIAEQEKEEAEKAEAEKKSYETYQKQFNNALSQYDMLINDSIYKGINLLKEDTLKVNFNEDKSAHLLIQGVDMTSEGIGLLSAVWNTNKDVQTSLEQVLSAQKKLRSAATKLGNCYSIVSERQNFTENLINVLTEGADKLTLADMNEEAANMLVLQTQQQLAINSLSLASQASQGVLRLF